MRRLTPAEAAAWRARSAERYRQKRAVKPLRATTRTLAPQQAKRRRALAEYRVTRAQRLVRARGRCEMEWDGFACSSVATETHHLMRRSHRLDHDVENLRALCLEHHLMIHKNIEWAKSHGWLRTEWRQIEPPGIDSAGGQV